MSVQPLLKNLQPAMAMLNSVCSIMRSPALSAEERAGHLYDNIRQYAKHVGVGEDRAEELVFKMAEQFEPGSGRPGEVPIAFSKIIKSSDPHGLLPRERRKPPHEQDDFSGINPDPNLVGEEDTKKMRHATNAEMLKLAQGGLAEEVRKRREDNPNLTERQVRTQIFAEHPDLYPGLRKLAQGPENELAKRSSSAELEAEAKTAEIQKAHPELTRAQAYSKAVLGTPGLMRKLLDEGRANA